jgi:SNF2 family DNA or RNA helicase
VVHPLSNCSHVRLSYGRLLITGTPLQNNLTQRTFSLLNFICSGIFVVSLFCRHLSVNESRDRLTCASKALDVDTVEALLEVLGVGMCIIHLRW